MRIDEKEKFYASFHVGCDGFVEIHITPDELREIANRLDKEWDNTGLEDTMPRVQIRSGKDFDLYIVYRE